MNVDKQIAALQADLNAANHITYLTFKKWNLQWDFGKPRTNFK